MAKAIENELIGSKADISSLNSFEVNMIQQAS